MNGGKYMASLHENPLLLLDNSTMHVLGNGTYKIEPMTFEEARFLIDTFETEEILRCYTDRAIDTVVHDYLGVGDREFKYKKIRKMRSGQIAIVFKQYITASETQPEIEPEPGIEAKKIQNVYVYCECITNMDFVKDLKTE